MELFVHSSSGSFSIKSGEVNTGFNEMGTYLISKPDHAVSLFIDDEEIHVNSETNSWEWSPAFYAGSVIAELYFKDHASPAEFILDVSPDSRKLGREEFHQKLMDIIDFSPELILGTEPATKKLGGQTSKDILWVAYARMKAYIEDYIRSLKSVCDKPIHRIKNKRENLPLHLVKRIDTTTVRNLSTKPSLIGALMHSIDSNVAFKLEDNLLDTPSNEITYDNPANRTLFKQIIDVSRKINWLITEFESQNWQVGETEADLAKRVQRRLVFLRTQQKELKKLIRQHPFDKITEGRISAEGLNAISAHPVYSYCHRRGINILRKGLSRADEKESHYISPTWQVYESWCYVELCKYFETSFPEFQWKKNNTPTGSDLVFSGNLDNKSLSIYCQLRAPGLSPSQTHGYYTTSKERIPDIVIELITPEEKLFIVFDAKYRVARPYLLDAMSSAHIYNDSLKKEDFECLGAFLLSPNADSVSELHNNDYLNKWNIGAFTFSRESTDRVIAFIHERLNLPLPISDFPNNPE